MTHDEIVQQIVILSRQPFCQAFGVEDNDPRWNKFEKIQNDEQIVFKMAELLRQITELADDGVVH